MSLSELHLIVYFVHLAVTIAALSCAYQVTQSVSPARWQLWLLLAVRLALGLAGFFASDPPTLFADFWSGYYAGGKAVLMGPTALRAVTDQGVSGLTSLPIVAYLFAPLTLLPIRLVAAMLAGASLLAVVASWMLIVRLNELDLRGRWLLAVLFAGSGPLQHRLREGNLTHFVLLALAGSLWLLKG